MSLVQLIQLQIEKMEHNHEHGHEQKMCCQKMEALVNQSSTSGSPAPVASVANSINFIPSDPMVELWKDYWGDSTHLHQSQFYP